MKALEKLLRRLSRRDRLFLEDFIEAVSDPKRHQELAVKKLRGSTLFRARKRRFRIIFHFDGDAVVIDDIRFRTERTYRDI